MSFVLRHNLTCVCIAVPRSLYGCNAQSAANGLHLGVHHDQRLKGHVGQGSPAGQHTFKHRWFSSNPTTVPQSPNLFASYHIWHNIAHLQSGLLHGQGTDYVQQLQWLWQLGIGIAVYSSGMGGIGLQPGHDVHL